MFDEGDLRLTMDDSRERAHRPLLPGLDDAAILSKMDPVERPRRPGLLTRKNEQKEQRWVY